MRWPDKVPAGSTSNEIVHEMDLYPTFARIAGGKVSTDPQSHGVVQLDFFLGEEEKSKREFVIIYVGNDILGAKWRNWKLMTKDMQTGFGEPVKTYPVPLIIDLHTDRKEEHPMDSRWIETGWVRWPAGQQLSESYGYAASRTADPTGHPEPFKPTGGN